MIKRIMFVCHGNICRSPMAEFIMKDLVAKRGLTDRIAVSSAAISDEAEGCGIHRGTIQVLRAHNIPFSEHRAVVLKNEDYEKYDCFALMDYQNLRTIPSIFPQDPERKIHLLLYYAGESREIVDPWYSGNFEQSYADILKGCQALLALYGQ